MSLHHLGRAVQLLDLKNQVVDPSSLWTVRPFAIVTDTVDFLVQSDRTALGDARLESTMLARPPGLGNED